MYAFIYAPLAAAASYILFKGGVATMDQLFRWLAERNGF